MCNNGTSAIRVRWVTDNSNGGYTSGDGSAVNNHQYSANTVGTAIPAYFNSGMAAGSAYTLGDDFPLDSSVTGNTGLSGNIAIRGGSGLNSYVTNSFRVEKLDDSGQPVQTMAEWPAAQTAMWYVGVLNRCSSVPTRICL